MRVLVAHLMLQLAAGYAGAADASCDPERQLRTVVGPAPIMKALRSAAAKSKDVFFKNEPFDEERFAYIGKVTRPSGKMWYVAFLETTWGCSGRSTPRLLIFSKDFKYIGQYSHFGGRQLRVEGDAIVFGDVAQEAGNRIQFDDDGPPQRTWIDGENPTLNR
jgi:hypothetical protein